MLDSDMDIESDLGIDSIKRVEILSTLEAELPGLPKVSPDMMGTLKTLGQIADYLKHNNQTHQTDETSKDVKTAATYKLLRVGRRCRA